MWNECSNKTNCNPHNLRSWWNADLVLANFKALYETWTYIFIMNRNITPFAPNVIRELTNRQYIQGGPKIAYFLYALSSSNIDRFSNLFHCQNQENICKKILSLNIPLHHKCVRYTNLWNVSVLKAITENKMTCNNMLSEYTSSSSKADTFEYLM